ncbi:hypothetical protein FDZ74_17765, partial [bacterium]
MGGPLEGQRAQRGTDLVGAHHVGQAVAAQHQRVAGQQRQALVGLGLGIALAAHQAHAHVHVRRAGRAKKAPDDVRVGVVVHLLGLEDAALERFLDPGVIGGKLQGVLAAHQV